MEVQMEVPCRFKSYILIHPGDADEQNVKFNQHSSNRKYYFLHMYIHPLGGWGGEIWVDVYLKINNHMGMYIPYYKINGTVHLCKMLNACLRFT